MAEPVTYKLGHDYVTDYEVMMSQVKAAEAEKRQKAAEEGKKEEKDEGAAEKDSFTAKPQPQAPRLPWMGRPTFY